MPDPAELLAVARLLSGPATFEPSNVASIIDSAAFAIEAFNSVVNDEKTDILALLLVRARPPTIPLPEP